MSTHPSSRSDAAAKLGNDTLVRLLEHDQAFLCVADPAGRILYLSALAGSLLRRDPDSVLGEHYTAFTPPEDIAAAREYIDNVVATPALYGPVIGRAMCGDGTFLWIETLLDSTDMAGAGLVMLSRDVSTRIEADEALRTRLLESQRFEVLGRLAGGVAHDLNNLLTVIVGYATLLSAHLPAGTDDQAQAEDVRTAAEHAAELVRQLHRLGRAGMGEVRAAELGDQVERLRELVVRALGPGSRFLHERERAVVLSFDATSLEQSLLLLAVWLRGVRPQGAEMHVLSGQRSLDAAHAARLRLNIGPHAMVEVELPSIALVPVEPPLVTAAIGGVLSRVGGAIEHFLLPENILVLRIYWPLLPPAGDAHEGEHPLVLNSARLSAMWRPLICAP